MFISCVLDTNTVLAGNLIQAYDSARYYDAQFQAAQAAFDAAVRRADQARGALLPSVSLSAGLGRAQTDYSPGTVRTETTRTLGLSATQALYRPVNQIAVTQADEQAEAARAVLEGVRQDLLARVAQAYFDVLAADDGLRLVQAQKRAVEQQLLQARRGFELGVTTITDEREAQARDDLSAAQEIGAQNDLHLKRLTLDQLVGQTGFDSMALAPAFQPMPLERHPLEHWIAQAMDHQSAIRQLEGALKVAELEVLKAEAGSRPAVDLTAGYSRQYHPDGTPGFVQPFRTVGANVGVQLTMPLFAGFAIQNRVAETLALRDKAEADLSVAQREAAQKVRVAFHAALSGFEQAAALRTAERSSLAALEANQVGYQVGQRINIDVLNAQSQLFQTRRDLAQARYGVLMSQLKLKQAAGVLTVADLYLQDGDPDAAQKP